MFLTNRSFLLKYHLGGIVLTGRLAPSAYWGSSEVSSISVSRLHSTDLKEIVSVFTLSQRGIYRKPKFTAHYCLNCALFQMKLSKYFPKYKKCFLYGIYISVLTRAEPAKYQSIILTLFMVGHRLYWQLFEAWPWGCSLGTKISLTFPFCFQVAQSWCLWVFLLGAMEHSTQSTEIRPFRARSSLNMEIYIKQGLNRFPETRWLAWRAMVPCWGWTAVRTHRILVHLATVNWDSTNKPENNLDSISKRCTVRQTLLLQPAMLCFW